MTLLLFVAACTGKQSDAELLSKAIAKRDIEVCDAISEIEERDPCRVAVVEQGAGSCDAVVAETWRDECWFVTAERAWLGGDQDEAVRSCEHSGRFSERCWHHLWRFTYADAFDSGDRAAHVAILRQAQVAFQRGSSSGSRSSRRGGAASWRPVMMYYFRQVPRVDPTVCEAMTELSDLPCTEWATTALRERLDAALASAPMLRGFCAEARASVSPWQGAAGRPWDVGWTADEAALEVVSDVVSRCR